MLGIGKSVFCDIEVLLFGLMGNLIFNRKYLKEVTVLCLGLVFVFLNEYAVIGNAKSYNSISLFVFRKLFISYESEGDL